MKKKITSILMAVIMVLGTVSPAMAAINKAELINRVNNSLSLLGGKPNFKTDNGYVEPVSDVAVPTDIEVKKSSDVAYGQSATLYSVDTVDFKTTMYMQTVKNTYNNYISLAKTGVNATDGDIDALDVSGQFIITVKFPQNAGFDAENTRREAVSAEANMSGFYNNVAGVVNGVFKETSRTLNAEKTELTITVDIKENTKASELKADNAFADLVLEYKDFPVTIKDSYIIEGSVTGYVDIKQGAEHLVHIPFVATQKEITGDTSAPNTIQAPFSYTESYGGGVSTVKKEATVTLNDGEKDYSKTTVELKNGKYVWDFAIAELPEEKENKLFAGWYLDAQNKRPASNKETITKDTTFYAGWIDTKCNIGFRLNGRRAAVNTGLTGSVVVSGEDIIVNTDNVEVKLSDIEIKGVKILGWFLDPEHTIPADDTTVITEDTIFYALTEEIDVPPVFDADGDHYAYIIGYPDGTVQPENNISRQEVATIFFRLLTEEVRTANFTSVNDFTDVNEGRWSNNAISTMAKMGIVSGYGDNKFMPDNYITRAEFATIAARFDDGEVVETKFTDMDGHWAEDYVAEASSLQWINGYPDGTFRPDNYITRAEVMTIVNRILRRKVSAENIHADANRWIDNPEEAWYYDDVVEATNSHKYDRLAEYLIEEKWTELLPNRDWSELEK